MASIALYTLMTPKFITLLIYYSGAQLGVALGLNVGYCIFHRWMQQYLLSNMLFMQYNFDTLPIKRWIFINPLIEAG